MRQPFLLPQILDVGRIRGTSPRKDASDVSLLMRSLSVNGSGILVRDGFEGKPIFAHYSYNSD